MKARKGEKKVRYEYWPVFDECVDEDEWKASLLRSGDADGETDGGGSGDGI